MHEEGSYNIYLLILLPWLEEGERGWGQKEKEREGNEGRYDHVCECMCWSVCTYFI